jgi:CRP-like cAMP-binding protein
MQGKVSIGDSIGEQEVVELTKYTHTVVATEDLEAIEIDKEAYR